MSVVLTKTTSLAAAPRQATPKSTTPLLLRLLNWIAEKDEHHRQIIKLRKQHDDRLKDLGLTRRQADQGFYQRFGNKSADQHTIILRNGW